MSISTEQPKVHISLSLSTSSSTISLSNTTATPTQAIVAARILDTQTNPSPIALQVNGTPLDGNHDSFHDALFHGVFSLISVADPSSRIQLSPPVRVNYGTQPSRDLRAAPFTHFATVPGARPSGEGKLLIKFDLTPERLFYCDSYPGGVKRADVKAGDRYRLKMQKLGRVKWWAFGDLEADSKGKKFVHVAEEADAEGKFDKFEVDGKKPDRRMLEADGWVFSEEPGDLMMSAEGDGDAVVEFID